MISVTTENHNTYSHIYFNEDKTTTTVGSIFILSYIILITNLFIKVQSLFSLKIELQTNSWKHNVISCVAYIAMIAQLSFMTNEINRNTIEMCSQDTDTIIYAILYSALIALTILIGQQIISISIVIILFIILHIVLVNRFLLSPFYVLFKSYFTLILDTKKGMYFYQPKTKDKNVKFGSNIILNLEANEDNILSINESVKLSAYSTTRSRMRRCADKNILSNIDETDQEIRVLKNLKILNYTKVCEIIENLLTDLSYFKDIDYDKIKEMEKSGKLLKSPNLTGILNIDQGANIMLFFGINPDLKLIAQILKERAANIIEQADINEYYTAFEKSEDENFYNFFVNEIMIQYLSNKEISTASLGLLMNELPNVICRMPLHMKQLYGDKTDNWKQMSLDTSSKIIDAYIALRQIEIENLGSIDEKQKWTKFR